MSIGPVLADDGDARPWYRARSLPYGELRGLFLVSAPVLEATREALVSFALLGINNAGHEGIVYWAGREMPGCTVFLQAIVPEAEHAHGRVHVSREAVGHTGRAARASRIGVLAQVHSHPGPDGRHSDGDDEMVLLPYEGMLSVVAPNFGISVRGIADLCVHQYQDGRWVLCSSESISQQLLIVPTVKDLRTSGDETRGSL